MGQGSAEPNGVSWTETPDAARERREAERFDVLFKLSVSVDTPEGASVIVTPAVVRNISRVGALVETKERLALHQQVTLAIPTEICPEGMALPQAFVGAATVARVEETGNGKQRVGVRFSDALIRNIEFVMFLDFLQTTAMTDWLLQQ